jgi:hypothetical protein
MMATTLKETPNRQIYNLETNIIIAPSDMR